MRELFEKDRPFRRADFFPAGNDDIGFQARAKIFRFFEQHLQVHLDREDHVIADAVAQHFPLQAQRLRDVLTRLRHLPDNQQAPPELMRLGDTLEMTWPRYARLTSPNDSGCWSGRSSRHQAVTATTAEAIAPPLSALSDPFLLALVRAEDEANEWLDKILSEGEKPLIVKVDLSLRNRDRLLEQVRTGTRVRLV